MQLFEPLTFRDHDYTTIVPGLGVEFTPNASGNKLTVKLRPGVTFHNGKPLTSEDVVFTFRTILDPKEGAANLPVFGPFIDRVEAADALTVQFTFKRPFFDFEDFAAEITGGIVPVGYDPKHPIGTGPFEFKSFTPGQQSVFTRYENYWGTSRHGIRLPYIDSLVIIDMADDTARVNALLSGAVDAIDTVSYALIPTVEHNPGLHTLVSKTGSWYPITMRTDVPPFSDVQVRQAFRLILDRPQMIADAYGGRAQQGNDLYATQDPLYDHAIPQRAQNIDQAKFLLKKAGHESLTVNLVTAPIAAGVVQSCVVFAEQAKAAGVNVQLTKLDNTTFYNNQYLYRPFSVDWWSTGSLVYTTALATGPGAPYNDTQWNNPQFNKWYYDLVGTDNPALKKEIASEMQKMLWAEGGEIIPGILELVDGHSTKVSGFVPDASGYSLSYWRFKDVWFV
jgi:peptide/nickel transport system substrate-binding protein